MGFRSIGIDGCKAGWIAVSLDAGEEHFWLIENKPDLLSLFQSIDCCLIDIPIGMEENKSTRTCDELLRRVLGSAYRSSVFSPPVRSALLTNDYKAGCDINQVKTGKRISKQAWNITPKIKMVDDILQTDKKLGQRVLESHPELLFKKLHRSGEPLSKKKTDGGKAQRLALLENEDGRISDLFTKMRATFKKKHARDDDFLDAFVLALTASRTPLKPLRTLPLPTETDSTGLPMAIHFI